MFEINYVVSERFVKILKVNIKNTPLKCEKFLYCK